MIVLKLNLSIPTVLNGQMDLFQITPDYLNVFVLINVGAAHVVALVIIACKMIVCNAVIIDINAGYPK